MQGLGRWVFLVLVGLGGTAVLVSLGLWQVGRHEQALEKQAALEERMSAPPVTVTGAEREQTDHFRRAQAVGRFIPEAEPIRFFASLKPFGPGERLVAPFVLENGTRILVDRGFVPQLSKESFTPPSVEQRLEGVLRWPNEASSFTPAPNPAQRLWFARDVPSMAAALDTQEILLVLSPSPQDEGFPRPMAAQIGQSVDHRGYAITWFSLAVIWLAMTVYLMQRTARRSG
ncbi:MAG: SURF1 family protein [Neomegalonema sp.]|nr:SURF1 family protein [Neomegalonema sp.]